MQTIAEPGAEVVGIGPPPEPEPTGDEILQAWRDGRDCARLGGSFLPNLHRAIHDGWMKGYLREIARENAEFGDRDPARRRTKRFGEGL